MEMKFSVVSGDVDMSWEVPQPATGDIAGLPADYDRMSELCFCAVVLTQGERLRDDPEYMDEGDKNPLMAAGLYFFIADGLGYNSGMEFYRPCVKVDEMVRYMAELTTEKFEANMPDYVHEGTNYGPLADPDWIIALGWTNVPI